VSTGTLKGTVQRLWAGYWLNTEQRDEVPGLSYLRDGGNDDHFFVCAMAPAEVGQFLKANAWDRDVAFAAETNWLLNDRNWFGRWTVFRASHQR
jgi:hypothetical protein